MPYNYKGLTFTDWDELMPCGHPCSSHYITVEEPDAPQDCCIECDKERRTL